MGTDTVSGYEIAMLVITVVATLASVISAIAAIGAKNEAIRIQRSINSPQTGGTASNTGTNTGVIASTIGGDVKTGS